MNDLIIRKWLMECVNEGWIKFDTEKDKNRFIHLVRDMAPSAQPKTGHWITKIKSDLRGDMWPTNPKCSKCGGEPYYSNTIYNYKFCPYCGARMVEPQKVRDKE